MSILSDEHDFKDDKHFLNYARAAYSLLLIHIIENHNDVDGQINVLDFFPENTHIFCYCTENIDVMYIQDYFHELYRMGYFTLYDSKKTIKESEYPTDKVLVIQQYSKYIKNIDYLKKIFVELLPNIDDPIFEFYFLYQVIEYFINEIMYIEQDDMIKNYKKGSTASEIRNSVHELLSSLDEKSRINKFVNKYTKTDFQAMSHDSVQIMKDFFSNNSLDVTVNNFSDGLYRTRNYFFHNHFRILDISGLDLINIHITNFICDAISSYNTEVHIT